MKKKLPELSELGFEITSDLGQGIDEITEDNVDVELNKRDDVDYNFQPATKTSVDAFFKELAKIK